MTDEELADDGEALGCLEHDGSGARRPLDRESAREVARVDVHASRRSSTSSTRATAARIRARKARAGPSPRSTTRPASIRLRREQGACATRRCRPRSFPAGRIGTKAQQAALRRLAASLLAGDGALPAPRAAAPPRAAARRRARCSAASSTEQRALARPARGLVPRRPGAARLGQDVPRRAADHAPARAGTEGRDHGAEPQGDPQPARRGRARGRRGGPRLQGDQARRPLRERARQDERVDRRRARPGGRRSSPARPGCSRARSSTGSSTRSSSTRPASISLADALACGTAARRLVLLGDPLQLAQVTQGVHPDGSGASVLEHVLGEHETIPEEHGRLPRARRGACIPTVCRFVSEAFYEGRLGSIPECAERTTSDGVGVRWLDVEHEGNRVESEEEADGDRGGDRAAPRPHVPGRRGRAPARATRRDGRRAVQRAGAAAARAAARAASRSARSTSSRAARPPSSSTRWRRRAARTSRAGSTS